MYSFHFSIQKQLNVVHNHFKQVTTSYLQYQSFKNQCISAVQNLSKHNLEQMYLTDRLDSNRYSYYYSGSEWT